MPEIIHVGGLEIDLASYRLLRDGDSVRLTPTEWALLREFINHPNQVLTHRVLLQRVWGDEYATESDYVHTYVSRLRRKLEATPSDPEYILTEAGLGYRFNRESEPVLSSLAENIPEPVPNRQTQQTPRTINSLPQQIDERYIGRDDLREQLQALLVDNTRLVSIYGRAGVGKTALACKVLTDIQPRFDGMVFLSSTSTGITLGRILSDFDRLLGEPETAPEQAIYRISHLLDRLSGGEYLLLLDNLEDLQNPHTNDLTDKDIETFLRVALEQGSTLRILVTSRYPLNLPRHIKIWERVVSLEEGLTLSDGVQFLRHSDPDGYAGLRDESDTVLEQFVQRTHGLPRALEAVAGLLLESPLMSPQDLLQDDSLLSEELGDLFIKGAIDTLGEESVRVMELLSLFDRAVPLDMLQTFATPYLQGEALKPILNRLVRAYFVSYNPDDRMVSMHPIDKDYCYGRLTSDERKRFHSEIAALYNERTDDTTRPQNITDLAAPMSAFQHWVLAEEHLTAAEYLLQLDHKYLSIWGNYTELADSYAQIIDQVTDQRVILRYGEALRRVGRLQEAISYFEHAYTLAGDDHHSQAAALSSLGWAHYDTGQFDKAMKYWRDALAIFRAERDKYGEGDSLSGMGWVSYLIGNYDEALNYIQSALTIFGHLGGHLHRVGMNIGDIGMIRAAQGDYESAVQSLSESLSIAETSNSLSERSYKGGYLAVVLLLGGKFEAAETVAKAAVQYDVLANRHFVAAVHGIALAKLGRKDEAAKAFERAVSYADRLLKYSHGLYNFRYARALALAGLAVLRHEDIDIALDEYGQAKALCSTEGVLNLQRQLLALLDVADQLAPVQRLLL